MPSVEVITTKPVQLITKPETLLSMKEAEIERGEQAVKAMDAIPEFSSWKVSRARGRVRFLKRFVELIKQGFIPIPRLEYDELHEYTAGLYFEKLPVEALACIPELRDKFNAIGIVRPRTRKQDPIILGILRYGRTEEHFILAWWRPDIMKPTELW